MVARLRVRLLGRFEVVVDGAVVPEAAWGRRHAAALVKLLALAPSASLHREQVLDALWPDLSVDEAAPRFHKAAHYARRAMGEGALAVRGDVVTLAAGPVPEVDVLEFIAAAEAAVADGGAAAASLALERWTGPLLPGDRYEPWADATRDRLDALHARLLRQAGRWHDLVEIDPTDEAAHLAVMQELAAAGDRRAALRQFERMDRVLRGELGVGPGPAAVALRDQLLAAGPAPAAGAPSTDAAVDLPAAAVAALDAATESRGRGLFVVGPAAAGRSRLLTAVAELAAGRGWRVGRSAAAAIEGAWPYAPVLEALADLCRSHPALLDGLDDSLRAELERALAGGDVDWRGDAGHRRLFVAAAELVRLAAGGAGAVLLIDDVHDADEASLRLLHHLVRASAQQRLLVVASHRNPRTGSALADVRASLLARGAAIDLVLEGPDDGGATPVATVVDGLPDDLRSVLRRVALAGASFDTDVFVAMSGAGERTAFEQLDAALQAGVVEVTASGYRFAGSEMRDAVAGDLPPHRLRELHREIAAALASLGASAARVAHHLIQGGDAAAAVPYALRAVRTEAALGAYRDALRLLDPIRASATGEEAAEVRALRAELLAASGDTGAIQAYREALELATGESRRRLVAGLARSAVMAGDLETARAALAGDVLDGGPADADILLATANLAFFSGDFDSATAAADEARRLVVDGDASWQLLELISLQGLLAHQRGEWFERLRLELRRTRDQPDLARAVFDGHLCVAEYLLYGPTPYDEVIELARSLRRTAAQSGALRAEAFACALAGEAARLAGRLDVAADELQESIDLHREVGSSAGESHSLQRLAEVRLAQGDREAAYALLQRALRLARWSTLALHLLQRIYGTMIAAAPDPAAARAVVDRAAAELGGDDLCHFCQVMLEVPSAIACADVGDLAAARGHLAAAEQSARLWDGTAWVAAIDEARAHLTAAEGDTSEAIRVLGGAAAAFDAAGQPLDAERCRASAQAFAAVT